MLRRFLWQGDILQCKLGGIEGLNGAKHYAIVYVNINKAETKYLKPMLDSRGASRPKPSYMCRFLSGFWHIAGFNGNCMSSHSLLKAVGCKVDIEIEPIKSAGKRLPVALFTPTAVASEL